MSRGALTGLVIVLVLSLTGDLNPQARQQYIVQAIKAESRGCWPAQAARLAALSTRANRWVLSLTPDGPSSLH